MVGNNPFATSAENATDLSTNAEGNVKAHILFEKLIVIVLPRRE